MVLGKKKRYKEAREHPNAVLKHKSLMIFFLAVAVLGMVVLLWYNAGKATGEATGTKEKNVDICGNQLGSISYLENLYLCGESNEILGECNKQKDGDIVSFTTLSKQVIDVVCKYGDSSYYWMNCGDSKETSNYGFTKASLGTGSYADNYFCTNNNNWIVCNDEHKGTNPNYLATGNYVGKALPGSFPYICKDKKWVLLSHIDQDKGMYGGQDAILCDNTKKGYIADVVTNTGNFDALCLGDKWAYCNVDEIDSDKIYYDMKNKVVDKGTVMFDNHMLCEKFGETYETWYICGVDKPGWGYKVNSGDKVGSYSCLNGIWLLTENPKPWQVVGDYYYNPVQVQWKKTDCTSDKDIGDNGLTLCSYDNKINVICEESRYLQELQKGDFLYLCHYDPDKKSGVWTKMCDNHDNNIHELKVFNTVDTFAKFSIFCGKKDNIIVENLCGSSTASNEKVVIDSKSYKCEKFGSNWFDYKWVLETEITKTCTGGFFCDGTAVTGVLNQVVCGTDSKNWKCTNTGEWVSQKTGCNCEGSKIAQSKKTLFEECTKDDECDDKLKCSTYEDANMCLGGEGQDCVGWCGEGYTCSGPCAAGYTCSNSKCTIVTSAGTTSTSGLKGDVNCDGSIDLADYGILKKKVLAGDTSGFTDKDEKSCE